MNWESAQKGQVACTILACAPVLADDPDGARHLSEGRRDGVDTTDSAAGGNGEGGWDREGGGDKDDEVVLEIAAPVACGEGGKGGGDDGGEGAVSVAHGYPANIPGRRSEGLEDETE